MILVPVKNLANAKQRLAPVLDQSARTELAQAMLADVLGVLAAWPNRLEVSVVTGDPFAIELASQHRFEVIHDQDEQGETAAVEFAIHACAAQQGVAQTLVIPGDIPLVQTSELERVLHSAPTEGSVLVPAADHRGTNAVLQRPVKLFPLRFGNDSFRPHLAAARAARKPCVVLFLPGIALDIDTPSDLAELAALPGETRSQLLARQWGFASLPAAANE